jgi:chorismate mutase-like protein
MSTEGTVDDLADCRERIDAIDTTLLELLNERARVVQQIGEIKEKAGLPVYAPEREDVLLRKLDERNPGPLTTRSLRAIYREIMSASLSLEKDLLVACAGARGALAHQAALSKFGSSIEYTFPTEITEVFQMVEKRQADCGVVPIETAEQGAIGQTLDCLGRFEVSICAEIRLSAEKSGQPGDRFFVLGTSPNPPSGNDRSFLLLRLEDKPGALVQALEPFVAQQINLHHFASRPAAGGSQDLLFFAEADGHLRDLLSSDLLRDLSKRCRAVKVLGSYPSVAEGKVPS